MRRTEWFMRVMQVFLLAYGLVALRDHSHEVFPFFAWSLFSTVPTPQNGDFDVRILSAQGLPRPGPIYFEDANLQPGAQEVQGQAALQSLGRLTRSTRTGAPERFASGSNRCTSATSRTCATSSYSADGTSANA